MQVQVELPHVLPKSTVKEMLSVVPEGDRVIVKTNFSSIDIIQTCPRKAYFMLSRGVTSQYEAPALVCGTGVHRAMEVWYTAPRDSRAIGSVKCDDSHALMLGDQEPLAHGPCARCAAIFAFLEATKSIAHEQGARSRENVVHILNNYFDTYLDDPYELVIDADGPLCERTVSMKIYEGRFNVPLFGMENPLIEIHFFGTIDSVLRNRETGEVFACDHKTTSSLGKDFLNRIRPNFQYTGYWWLLREVLGITPSRFMVNGIQIAKTKTDLARQFTTIDDEDILELKRAIMWNVGKYLQCLSAEQDARQQGDLNGVSHCWPMSTPSACSMWGGCSFKKVCETPARMHDSVLSADYMIKGECE